MIKLLNKILSGIKGESFYIDTRVPPGYIIKMILLQMVSLCWGIVRFRRFKSVFVNPSATIKCPSLVRCGKNFRVGRRSYVDALSREGLVCGDNVSIGNYTNLEITGSLKCLGKGIRLGNNVSLGTYGNYGGAGGVEIGDDTIIGSYVSVHPENHNYDNPLVPIRLQGVNHKGIKIGKDCWIGAKATILDGAVIGNGCIVAAGAVVRGSFPDNVIIGGVPAKILKERVYVNNSRNEES